MQAVISCNILIYLSVVSIFEVVLKFVPISFLEDGYGMLTIFFWCQEPHFRQWGSCCANCSVMNRSNLADYSVITASATYTLANLLFSCNTIVHTIQGPRATQGSFNQVYDTQKVLESILFKMQR